MDIIRELLSIPEHYDIKHVISLGIPDEQSFMESYKDSFKYWKDENGDMHVPKKALKEIILKEIWKKMSIIALSVANVVEPA